MDCSFRAVILFFLIALLAVVSTATADEPMDFEDIQDPALREQIIRQVETKGEEEVDSSRAPTTQQIAQERRLPYPICGTFILCERKGGFFGFPDAQLFTGFRNRIFPRTTGACRTTTVRGTSGFPANTQVNHARLWPIFGEEFGEMCFYTERQHACTSGQVTVQDTSGTVLYKCDQYYDAHTVQFCMSKYPYYCRFNNPADILFATTTPATART